MGMVIPTVDEVCQSFRRSLDGLGIGRATDDEFGQVVKRLISPDWQDIGNGEEEKSKWQVQGMVEENQIRLVKVESFQFIEIHVDGQRSKISEAMNGIVQCIRTRLLPEAVVDWVEINCDHTEESFDHPTAKKVVCWAKGIVR
jgi:hypothetical protein